jgi:hypothetical protein
MPAINRKKCRHCQDLFVPDHRNRNRQKYCRKPACSKASKAASQKRWLQKPENQNYFRGPENAQRVQQWRKEHPGYSSGKPKIASDALQDPLIHQPIENDENNSKFVGWGQRDVVSLLINVRHCGTYGIAGRPLKGKSREKTPPHAINVTVFA